MLAKQLNRTDRLLCLLFVALGGMIGAISLKPQATMAIVGLLLASRFLYLNYKALMLIGVMLIPINQVPFINLATSFNTSAVTLGVGLLGLPFVLHKQWNGLTRAILMFILYLALEVILTAYKYHSLGLLLPFKYGVSFFFFLFTFAVIALTPTERDAMRFLILALLTNVGLSVFYVLQSITGASTWDIFTHQYNILEEGLKFRIFNYAIFTYNFLFLVSLAMLMFVKRYRFVFILGAGVLLVAIFANFSRSNYLCVGVGFLAACVYFFMERIRQVNPAKLIRTVLIIVVGGVVLFALDPSIRDTVFSRGLSALDDLQNNSGTWKARTDVMGLYIDIFLNNMYLGAGFVHSDAGVYNYLPSGGLMDSDLGLLNILVLMGLFGAALYLVIIIQVIRFSAQAKAPNASPMHKAFAFSCFAYVIGGLVSSMTNPIFVGVAGILPLSVGMGLLLSTRPAPQKKSLSHG